MYSNCTIRSKISSCADFSVQLVTHTVIETARKHTFVSFRAHVDGHSSGADRGSAKGTETGCKQKPMRTGHSKTASLCSHPLDLRRMVHCLLSRMSLPMKNTHIT